jgi:hypothetical protein
MARLRWVRAPSGGNVIAAPCARASDIVSGIAVSGSGAG